MRPGGKIFDDLWKPNSVKSTSSYEPRKSRSFELSRDAMRILMPIESGSIRVGRCYVTPNNDVRKVLEVSSAMVTYVVRGKMAFPSWDAKAWQSTNKQNFASEVSSEVPCDWQPRAFTRP